MCGAQTIQEFVHFLLPVAGCFPDHKPAKMKIRAGIGEGKAVARFDQGTQIAGQVLFARRNGNFAGAAKRDRYRACRPDDFLGGIGAVTADNIAPAVHRLLDFYSSGGNGFPHCFKQ